MAGEHGEKQHDAVTKQKGLLDSCAYPRPIVAMHRIRKPGATPGRLSEILKRREK